MNRRTSDGFADWFVEISTRLAPHRHAAPFGVNLIVHKTNTRLQRDLEITVQHQVPVVITSLGTVPDVVSTIHSYGGLVFHDVVNIRHAQKASAAGVDAEPNCTAAIRRSGGEPDRSG